MAAHALGANVWTGSDLWDGILTRSESYVDLSVGEYPSLAHAIRPRSGLFPAEAICQAKVAVLHKMIRLTRVEYISILIGHAWKAKQDRSVAIEVLEIEAS